MNYSNLDKTINQYNEKTILVIGDLILDEFIFGKVERINPEAPVPILNVKKKEFRLGGAANVAQNVISLGGKCVLFGVAGDDESAQILIELAKTGKLNYCITKNKSFPTIRKIRAIAQNHHLLRLDFEENYKTDELFIQTLKECLEQNNFDAVIISDYGKGTINQNIFDVLKLFNIPVFVDPKPVNKELYKNAFLITPNLKEAKELAGKEEGLGGALCEIYNSNILITKGEQGMSLYELGKEELNIPTQAKEVCDVTGAGDVVIAALALSYTCCKDLEKSARISNIAAGISVGKIGTAQVLQQELLEEVRQDSNKIKTLDELKSIIHDLKLKNKKIVFTNGCFDILHTGHTRLFSFAKKQGDILILGLNSDDSVKRLKGSERPINSQEKRAEVLANFSQIDYITLFEEDTPLNLVENLRPDIIVKGGDYKPENVVGNNIAEVRIFNTVEGESTTNALEKMKSDSVK